MSADQLPHRCPKCRSLVVDRRSPVCTTCRTALPADWVMTPRQVKNVQAIDLAAKAEHLVVMKRLDAVKTSEDLP
jgi:hypothetical protein